MLVKLLQGSCIICRKLKNFIYQEENFFWTIYTLVHELQHLICGSIHLISHSFKGIFRKKRYSAATFLTNNKTIPNCFTKLLYLDRAFIVGLFLPNYNNLKNVSFMIISFCIVIIGILDYLQIYYKITWLKNTFDPRIFTKFAIASQ